MDFPVYVNLGFIKLHPHPVLETLAYLIGFRLYLWTRSKGHMSAQQSIWIVVAAIIGAAAGSKILYWFEDPMKTIQYWHDFTYMMEGKTIVGGLLGGLIGVEWMKKRVGVNGSTGDDMVIPLIVGMSIGRIGCFLTGLDDHTYGTATHWWTGIDFGDGILRHPTQLYEIVFLLTLGTILLIVRHRSRQGLLYIPNGGLFQLFMTAYLLQRLLVDFIKPVPHPYLGLNNIQVACILGIIYYLRLLIQWKRGIDHVDHTKS